VLAVAENARADRAVRRDRLIQRRKALGLTQEDLATLLKVDPSTVVRWERGTTRPLPWLWPRLARVLKVPPGRLEALLAADGTAGSSAEAAVPRQLPAAVAGFTGRAAELAVLARMLDEAGAGSPGTVVISAIGGTAGVGKTALALQWAHQAAARFPDGQLYVNLRGFGPTGIPVAPGEAVRGFLDALGVPPERIPRQAEAQGGLYRSLLAGKRMLIVADNAGDEEQVRPLLPASPGSLVLVTSRNQLSGLAAADGARLLRLDVLSHGEAVQMLTARFGASRAAAEPGAVAEIAGLCACLPLALAVAAACAVARPIFALDDLAAELRDGTGRLDALDAGDPAASVRAVFSWSYRQLSPQSARMFRLLGLHPGPDITVPAAASLAAAARSEARRLLGELTRAHLISEHVPGRYAFHDLLRAYAAAQARDTDRETERGEAIGRVLDHYLHTAAHSVNMIDPGYEQVPLAPPRPGTAPEQLVGRRQSMAWFEAEHQVLLAAATLAAEPTSDSHAWQLPWAITPYLRPRGYFQELAAIQRPALAAAIRLGDIGGQAVAARLLADACLDLGDDDQALGYCSVGLELYRRLGNRLGEAKIHQSLGVLEGRQGHYADALGHDEHALRLYQAIGNKAGQADALNDTGCDYAQRGDYERARACCQQALALSQEVSHRHLEGAVWDSLGYIEHHLSNFGEATACYQRSLDIMRELGDRFHEGDVLSRLGDTHLAAGDLLRARQAWQDALAILEGIQHPDAKQVRAKLDSANETRG
jgi:tetratricopeptide (TPR) repeat protein/transcriptional regulator with XRE-family HTH domain